MTAKLSKTHKTTITTTTSLLAALLLAGCGGGGDGGGNQSKVQSFSDSAAPQAEAVTTPDPTTPSHTGPSGESNIAAATCDFSSVQAAVDKALEGWTVSIPAGDCNWGSNELRIQKGIHVKGAGKDITTIRRSGYVDKSQFVFTFDCSAGAQVRFSDMTLVGNGNGSIQDNGLGLLNSCVDFKVWNTKFTKFVQSAIEVRGDASKQRGVIFQNDFLNNYSADLANLGYAVVVYGSGTWPALELGTQNAVFIEQNYMTGNRHDVASNNGSRYVFRYNTVIGDSSTKDFQMIDAHGLDYHPRGSRQFEIYENTISSNINDPNAWVLHRSAINVRGGSGVIFNNKVGQRISRTVELDVSGSSCGTYPATDQLSELYIWNNTAHDDYGYTTGGIDNNCPSTIGLNRDYFPTPKTDYQPYTYPHPLR